MKKKSSHAAAKDRSRNWAIKAGILLLVCLAAAGAYLLFRDKLSLEQLAKHEATLRDYQSQHPFLAFGLSFLGYVILTGLSLPFGFVLSAGCGWFFGFVKGLLLVSLASSVGATLAFLLSRFLLRDMVQSKFGSQLEKVNEALEREGAWYLFTLRLIPMMPFFIINLVFGLTPMRAWTFWWVSIVGMLPGAAIFVYAGSSVPSLETLAKKGASEIVSAKFVIALIVAAIFPVATKLIIGKFKDKPRRGRSKRKK